MLPMLRFAADRQEHSLREAIEGLTVVFWLTQTEQKLLLLSRLQPIFDNHVSWARSYMKQAGLLESPRRGYFRITQRGLDVLAKNPSKIDLSFLSLYREFVKFRSLRKHSNGALEEPEPSKETPAEPLEIVEQKAGRTPEEIVEEAYIETQATLRAELLERILQNSPHAFESLIIDLLVAMGYGGSRRNAARQLGRSGDGGVDGVINEDALGLDRVYVQAKRYGKGSSVGRPEVQAFVGSLVGLGANKGIFVTTSTFSSQAVDFVSRIPQRVILIDGKRLTELMIEHSVGVRSSRVIEFKRVDEDFFTEE